MRRGSAARARALHKTAEAWGRGDVGSGERGAAVSARPLRERAKGAVGEGEGADG